MRSSRAGKAPVQGGDPDDGFGRDLLQRHLKAPVRERGPGRGDDPGPVPLGVGSQRAGPAIGSGHAAIVTVP